MIYLSCYIETTIAAAAAKSLQSCLTLCDPIYGSPPGSPIPGILRARTLEWVAISFPSAWKWKVKSLSHVRLLETPWTAAFQAPTSVGFARQEYWSGVPLPSPKTVYKAPIFLVSRVLSSVNACGWIKEDWNKLTWLSMVKLQSILYDLASKNVFPASMSIR